MSERFLSRLATDRRSMDEHRSIAEHLQTLLNAQEGLSATTPDYGLPDLTDIVHTLPGGISTIQNAIRDAVIKYEPRLCKVNVRFIPSEDPFVLYFEISARKTADASEAFTVRTEMLPGNRFKVGR